jgi:hypothetical protein
MTKFEDWINEYAVRPDVKEPPNEREVQLMQLAWHAALYAQAQLDIFGVATPIATPKARHTDPETAKLRAVILEENPSRLRFYERTTLRLYRANGPMSARQLERHYKKAFRVGVNEPPTNVCRSTPSALHRAGFLETIPDPPSRKGNKSGVLFEYEGSKAPAAVLRISKSGLLLLERYELLTDTKEVVK